MSGAGSIALKVCGVTRREDLDACIELEVDAVGFNLWPGSKRFVDPVQARGLIDAVTWGAVLRVGVFVDAPIREVELAIATLGLDLVQPHGDAPVEPYARLAAHWKVGWIWVIRGTPALDRLEVPEPAPAWVLLDAAVAGFGGAGQTTDWDWAAQALRRLHPLPVWLAGGIDPSNAAQAIARVGPAGLDVASGVETAPGHKSREAIASLRAICNNPRR
ncbi:phosphoribosylanthranilate isomerase [Nannocystaceae bacterium ST9]